MNRIKTEEIDGLAIKLYQSIDAAVEDVFCHYMDSDYSAVAINPEKIMLAKNDETIRNILVNNEIRYPDGIGVVKFLSYKSKIDITRIPGCELWEAIMQEAGKRATPVYLVGSKPATLKNTVNKLQDMYSVNIAGYHDGYFSDEKLLINDILNSKAKIVTVALGSPKQEIFISECRAAGINAFFMGVGGTYDVFTGNVKRAPKFFCDLGLEWFYRLISQPTRIYRQRNLFKFLVLACSKKL
jgi:UDP-N-acetyl-D-mannosaminouronate:lipid I N-acetyl-D-mannosaminouronosyltransferase